MSLAEATAPGAPADPGRLLDALAEARSRTMALVAPIGDRDLERVHDPLMSPLVWDLGHIAAFEDLWLVHRLGGRPLLRPDLAGVYDAFETPRAHRGDLPFLRRAQVQEYMAQVRARAVDVLERHPGDGLVAELVIRHEAQHCETMLQAIGLARLPGWAPAAPARPLPLAPAPAPTGLELVAVEAGPCTIGAPGRGFAYDNERPRRRVDLPAFAIGRVPITNASFLSFVEGGGYERREWWSDEGWAWKEDHDITHPGGWTGDGHEWRMGRLAPIDPDKPVVHVSWFEAAAFATAHGARLPTEEEWEKAATWSQDQGEALAYPWGCEAPGPAHANLDQLGLGTAPAGAHPAGRSPWGCEGMLGDVWEWTQSRFGGYPGFRAHPYREYSEVFFGDRHRVLRGGSWATRARVATPTFRNWDLPQRRQIFAGFRIARDVDPPTPRPRRIA